VFFASFFKFRDPKAHATTAAAQVFLSSESNTARVLEMSGLLAEV
jgi:hypothetical protein